MLQNIITGVIIVGLIVMTIIVWWLENGPEKKETEYGIDHIEDEKHNGRKDA